MHLVYCYKTCLQRCKSINTRNTSIHYKFLNLIDLIILMKLLLNTKSIYVCDVNYQDMPALVIMQFCFMIKDTYFRLTTNKKITAVYVYPYCYRFRDSHHNQQVLNISPKNFVHFYFSDNFNFSLSYLLIFLNFKT